MLCSHVCRYKENCPIKLIDAHQMVFWRISRMLADVIWDIHGRLPYSRMYVTVDSDPVIVE
jgi:hypothetical protein